MQAQAVKQLGFVCRHALRQAMDLGGVGVALVPVPAGHSLYDGHALQYQGHVFQCRRRGQALTTQSFDQVHHGRTIGAFQGVDQTEHMAAVHAAQHLAHSGFLQLSVAKSNGLIGQTQSVAHRASGGSGKHAQSQRLGAQLFLGQHLSEVFEHRLRRHRPQIELQAT